MNKKILLSLVIILLASLNLYAQTKFDDAVAMNFKNTTVAVAGYFDDGNNLVIARQIAKEGSYYLEIGKYDDNGQYTVKKILELNNDPEEVKVRFNFDGSKAGILEISQDRTALTYVDLGSGEVVQDFKLESVNNFFLTPDGRSIVVTAGSGSMLFDIGEGEPIINYSGEMVYGISSDGNTLFCRNGGNIDYLETKTGKKIRSFPMKDLKSIDFDGRGEIMLCLTSQ